MSQLAFVVALKGNTDKGCTTCAVRKQKKEQKISQPKLSINVSATLGELALSSNINQLLFCDIICLFTRLDQSVQKIAVSMKNNIT